MALYVGDAHTACLSHRYCFHSRNVGYLTHHSCRVVGARHLASRQRFQTNRQDMFLSSIFFWGTAVFLRATNELNELETGRRTNHSPRVALLQLPPHANEGVIANEGVADNAVHWCSHLFRVLVCSRKLFRAICPRSLTSAATNEPSSRSSWTLRTKSSRTTTTNTRKKKKKKGR